MSVEQTSRSERDASPESELGRLRRELAAATQRANDSDTRHRMILDSAVEYAVVALDLEGLVTEWSTGASRIMGWSEAEMLGRPVTAFFTDEDRRAGIPELEMSTALRDGRATDERWHRRKDGSRFWANGEMMPLKDAAGATQGYIKILRDRTGQHQAAEKNRADAEFLRSVLEASSDCIKVLDLDAKLTFMSEGGQRVMEVSDFNAIRGCPWPDFWQNQGNADAKAAVATARAGGIGRFRGMADTMAGTPKWWDVQVTPMFGADGRPEKLLSVSRDITPTYAAEAALRASEQHWRGLFERLREGLIVGEVVRDARGRITDWRYLDVNPAWGELVGVAPETVAGRTIRDVFPGIENFWIDQVTTAMEDGPSATFVQEVSSLNRWYEGRVHRIGADRFCIIFREITEQREAERRRLAALELSDRLREDIDPDALALLGCQVIGHTLRAGRVGYGRVEADGETFHVERDWTADGMPSLAGRYRMDDYGAYADDLRRGETVVVADIRRDERTVETADSLAGVAVRSLINIPVLEGRRIAAVLYVNDARPRRWTDEEIAFTRDMAERMRQAIERRRAEQELRDLAALLERQVAERTRDLHDARDFTRLVLTSVGGVGAWTHDIASDKFFCSFGIADLYALDPVQAERGISRTDFLANVHPDDKTALAATMASGLQQAGDLEHEYRICHPDGSIRWVLSRGHTYHEGGRAVRRVGVGVETTKQHLLEEQLRQSQKMEAVGQLTGGLAHDFNNLLTGVTGSLELLQTRIAQGRIRDVDRYVAAAQGAARRAGALTHRLLAFSRRQTLAPKPTDGNRLVREMEELIRRTVGPAIAIDVREAPELWSILVDPGQLENALLNLCINARDAMPDGGRIVIETENRWLDERTSPDRDLPPGHYVTLCVSDTGTGMPPEVIAKAFDPFFTTKPIGQGTGLGLSMIYGFAKQSGGQVRIDSEVGRGTTVCIFLPRHLGEVPRAEAAPALADAPRAEDGQTVLVIDDEPTVRMLVTEVLEDLGYKAIEAADGASGLQVLQSDTRIDLLVTDVGLPGGMNGRQVADAARVARPNLKVMFVTGYAESAVLSHGHLEPGMHVLVKPFAMEALASQIKELISQP